MPSVAPSTVVAGDTFTIELEGYNSTDPSGNFYAIQPDLTPTFGMTQTFPGDAANGQTLTVTSGETQSGNTFTDTITISVPNSFIPVGTKDSNGNITDSLEFSIGNYNVLTGTGDTLDYTSALTGAVITGSAKYTLNGNPGTLPVPSNRQNPMYTNGNMSLSDLESVNTPNKTDIGAYAPNNFTLKIVYSVPEPSTYATVLLGAAGLCWLTAVRRRVRA